MNIHESTLYITCDKIRNILEIHVVTDLLFYYFVYCKVNIASIVAD